MLLRKGASAVRARLIDDARHAWRFASVWIAAAGAALIEIWNQLPESLRQQLPAPIARTAPTVILVLVIGARLFKQKDASDGR